MSLMGKLVVMHFCHR